MSLRNFKVFELLCKELNMTRTAEKLGMTQPSISQSIAELEEHFQTTLFERQGKRLYLNQSGAELLTRVKDILSSLEDMENHFRNTKPTPKIRIGASATVGSYMLPSIIQEIRSETLELQLECRIENTAKIESAILAAELDFGIVEGKVTSSLLKCESICKDRLVLVGLPGAFTIPNISGAKLLESLPFLVREQGSGTGEQTKMFFDHWNIQPRITGTASNIDALYRFVKAGLGVAFLPWLAVEKDIAAGQLELCNYKGSRILRNIRIVYHKTKKPSEEFRLTLQKTKTALRQLSKS